MDIAIMRSYYALFLLIVLTVWGSGTPTFAQYFVGNKMAVQSFENQKIVRSTSKKNMRRTQSQSVSSEMNKALLEALSLKCTKGDIERLTEIEAKFPESNKELSQRETDAMVKFMKDSKNVEETTLLMIKCRDYNQVLNNQK